MVASSKGHLWSMDSKWGVFSVLKIPDWGRFRNNFENSGSRRKSLHCLIKTACCSSNLLRPRVPPPPRRSLDLTPNGQSQRTHAPASSKSTPIPSHSQTQISMKTRHGTESGAGYSKSTSDLQPDFIRLAGLFLSGPVRAHGW